MSTNVISFLDLLLYHYVMTFFVPYNSLCLKSILTVTSIATPAFFWVPFARNIFFPFFQSLCALLSQVRFL